jgi:ribosomal-protein-alanine N-acetyltransferase
MQLDVRVKIQADKLSQTEYLIKDRNDIIIGRFSNMELESSS